MYSVTIPVKKKNNNYNRCSYYIFNTKLDDLILDIIEEI